MKTKVIFYFQFSKQFFEFRIVFIIIIIISKWGEGRPVEEIPCNRSLKATELYSKAASEAAKETGYFFYKKFVNFN